MSAQEEKALLVRTRWNREDKKLVIEWTSDLRNGTEEEDLTSPWPEKDLIACHTFLWFLMRAIYARYLTFKVLI